MIFTPVGFIDGEFESLREAGISAPWLPVNGAIRYMLLVHNRSLPNCKGLKPGPSQKVVN